ncbi:carbon-nitrogen hydrolase [Sporormia fimetaria CBS 119925]|uniref:Carbon-nitrogen hydrolase n=1 Tax=Sporormia fimetaria CBS 119925 TaxID=1340428 RepID=A0A6A6V3K3_9PLEO|nr:carbon-nitrogen hydrolase [Sporormia fimetaria CBS 119925]
MPQKLKVASAQVRTLSTTSETLRALEQTTKLAAKRGADVLLFPEAYLGGYPRTCSFGNAVGGRTEEGREQFLHYFHDAVDMGDTPRGAGDDWIERKLPLPKDKKYRGDGTREELERIARETGVFVVTGLVERAAGTLYCGVVYVCPRYGVIGKRRKVMPTGSERTIWGQGSASTLRAVTTEIKGVRLCMAAAICWENYMPLLRQALYSQNVNLWFAPTADARDAWGSLMRTIGIEGRCFVVSANQCVERKHLPEWISGPKAGSNASKNEFAGETVMSEDEGPISASNNPQRRRSSIIIPINEKCEIALPARANESSDDGPKPINGTSTTETKPKSPQKHAGTDKDFICRGGSSIISPMGEVLAGPLWEVEDELLIEEVDFEDCERGRLDMDVAGSYSRMDSFHLTVVGLDLNPPP